MATKHPADEESVTSLASTGVESIAESTSAREYQRTRPSRVHPISLSACLLLAAVALALAPSATASPLVAAAADCPSCVADFALYNPSQEEDGVWEEEVKALKAIFKDYKFSYKTINAADINGGDLGVGPTRRYRALIAPGGWAYYRKLAVTAIGDANIRAFIASAGNYVGFCAGAYWVLETVTFAKKATGGDGDYNRSSDYKSYAYDVKLLNGKAKGPFGWSPWKNGKNPSLERVSINNGNATMKKIGLPGTTRFFYAGGPVFIGFDKNPPAYEIWAKAKKPSGTSSAASTGSGKPTVIRFGYGSGSVILFSYHPEILIHSKVDNVKLSKYYDEDDIKWDTGSQSQSEVNLDSWNIVHAALQTAADQPVTKLKSLPK